MTSGEKVVVLQTKTKQKKIKFGQILIDGR